METEIWKDIDGYEGLYQVSNLGKIISLNYNHTGNIKVMKLSMINGYYSTSLWKNKKGKLCFLHRALAKAFIPNPDNKPQVNHINGVRNDNRIENLEWVTSSENQLHKFRVLGYKNIFQTNHPDKGKFGKLHKGSKKVNQYDLNGNFIKTWDSVSDIGRYFKTHSSNISRVCRCERKKSLGFRWEYVYCNNNRKDLLPDI